MMFVAGTRLDRYEIHSMLGEGGMGEVYLAQDKKLDRKVALKILPNDVAANQDRMRRFVQEAKSARSEEHTSELQSPCNLVCRLLLEKKDVAIDGAGPAMG